MRIASFAVLAALGLLALTITPTAAASEEACLSGGAGETTGWICEIVADQVDYYTWLILDCLVIFCNA